MASDGSITTLSKKTMKPFYKENCFQSRFTNPANCQSSRENKDIFR
jgi:hypothetical protein